MSGTIRGTSSIAAPAGRVRTPQGRRRFRAPFTGRLRQRPVLCVLLGAVFWGMPPAPGSEKSPSTQPETLEGLVRQYIELRTEAVRLQADWQEQKAVLEAELKLLTQEIAAARTAFQRQQERNAALEQKVDAAIAQRDALRQTLAEVQKAVDREHAKLRRFVATLPPPLRKRIESAGNGRAAMSQSSGTVEALADLLKELEAVQSVDQEVHLDRMMLRGPQGVQQEAQILFFGLGAAYALGADGRNGARARIESSGWSWQWSEDLASPILEAIERHTQLRPPGFVPLPVEIRIDARDMHSQTKDRR